MQARLPFILCLSLLVASIPSARATEVCRTGSRDAADKTIADCTAFLAQPGLDKTKKADALRTRARAYDDKDDIDRALADLTEGIRLDPRNADLFHDRASIYRFGRKDIDRSMADITESDRLRPDYYPTLSFRGALHVQRNDLPAATADYGEVIRLNGKSSNAYFERGEVWLMRGDYRRALEDFDAGHRLDPTYANVVRGRNRAHAALAVGAALSAPSAGGDFQANPIESSYVDGRSWSRDGAFHHCSYEFNAATMTLVLGRGRSGYALALASSAWALSPGTSYPVQVAIGDAPRRTATATVIDPISIALPLGDDRTIVSQLSVEAVTVNIHAGSNTISLPSPDDDGLAKSFDACWTAANAPIAETNPFASALLPSAAADPSAGAEAAQTARAAEPAVKPKDMDSDRLAAFRFGAYGRWAAAQCDVKTTFKQREAIETRLNDLAGGLKEAAPALVNDASDRPYRCPPNDEALAMVERELRRFVEVEPKDFVGGMPEILHRELTRATPSAKQIPRSR